MKVTLLLLAVFSLFIFPANAQKAKKTETIQIKTSAVCNMCKHTIETALYNVKGVKSANLDVPSKVVTVSYKPSAVTPEQLRTAITKVGYDADDVPADPQAYQKLHGCCKKGAH
ncbi:MAG TPA: heavy metal-associated domain-containing protein [Chitinophagales bacterium]|nr:heavy metal-associated domain-containing protein [Chitinophagales bacterium]